MQSTLLLGDKLNLVKLWQALYDQMQNGNGLPP